jgi:TonB-linked SusC/RagA family outer membrane protein
MKGYVSNTVRRFILTVSAVAVLPAAAVAQVTLTGRVTSQAGDALRDASVTIPSLNLVVYVGSDGNYRLVVPAARTLNQQVTIAARMIGFKSSTVQLRLAPGATLTQDFRLTPDPLRLEEVVVTGSGTESMAERLGTARASVDAATIQRSNEVNVIQALAGKVPNVVTNQTSGDPGASTSILIRGPKTFGTSQPLIIVDGVPTNNATRVQGSNPVTGTAALSGAPSPNRAFDINPADIESVEILKGAAATSIYGASAGSAGAILITTKRGKSGRTQYTLSSTYQSDKAIQTLPVQQKYGVGSGGVTSPCNGLNCTISSNFFSWGAAIPEGTPVYDHSAEMYERGHTLDNTISMSGGSERTTFFLSAGALHQNGFIVGDRDYLDRYTVRFNGSHALFEKLTIGASGGYFQTKAGGIDRGNSINGLSLSALRQPPDFNAKQYLDPVTGLHRSWRFPNPSATAFTNSRGFDNPFYAINEDELVGETGRFQGNLNANWRPVDWLSVNYVLGADYNNDDRTFGYGQASSGLNGGQLERWQFYDRLIDSNLNATGSWRLRPNISATLTVGQNLNETYFRQVDVLGQTLIAPGLFKLANTVSRTVPTDAETRRRLEGYFAQATTDLYDQLFLQARLRNDGNSALSPGHQRAWYPGASAAWSFTKAVHLPASIVSFGKLRVAYGESGQQPPLYATQDVFVTTAFADFNPASIQTPTLNGIGGLYASATRGNPDISPERVRELEAGVDLNLLQGYLDLSVTHYNSKSHDVIFAVGLPPSTGYTGVNFNAGELTNKGWEATSTLRVLQRKDFSFELGANWGRNRNLVTSLGQIPSQLTGEVASPTPENCGPEAKVPRCTTGIGSSFSGQATFLQVGYPFGIWRSQDFARCGRGLKTIGANNIEAACQGAPDGALYIAANGFPIADPTERAIGNPWPDWTGGLSAELTFKGVQLSAFLDHRQGGNVLNMTRSSMYQYGTHKDTEIRGTTQTFGKDVTCYNITCNVLNGPVVGPGAGTAVVMGESWFTGLAATGGPITTRLEDATNTRLREVTIGYTFRGSWIGRLGGTQALDLKLSGRNLKLWTDYSGYDPETNLGGAQNANRGIDWFNTPLTRAWVLAATLHY